MLENKILEYLNEAILLFDRDLVLTYINPAGEMLFADSAKHLAGQHAKALFKSCNSSLLDNLMQCRDMHEALINRELPLNTGGQNNIVNFSSTPVIEDNQLVAILVELQQFDRHLRITREEQLLAQQNTSRMLARGLAHEIKNPLGGLRGAAQLLELELNDSELKEYTQIIIAESDRLQDLMDKMLGPNRPAQKSLINIHEPLERIKQLIMAECSDKIQLKADYDPSIPDFMADTNQLIQAFLNIARNAVQALQEGGEILLRTRIQRHVTIGRNRYKLCVKVDIIDNGPGINPDLLNQIFYPMITGRADGTGLGLSIAQSLINQHNGLIECESRPGCTEFSIFLPLITDDE